MTFIEDLLNTDDPEDSEPNKEDYRIAKNALDIYVRHNRLGKLCMCKGCAEMRAVYARIMQLNRQYNEGEEWKDEGETLNGPTKDL